MDKKDNPLRLRRLLARLPQAELARRAGIHRSSLVFIEQGQTRDPSHETLVALAAVLGTEPSVLQRELDDWQAKQAPTWNQHQAAILAESPAAIAEHYPSFRAWRLALELPVPKLAAIIGVSRSAVLEYESGIRRGGMPDSIMSGLLSIGLSSDRALALAELPPNE